MLSYYVPLLSQLRVYVILTTSSILPRLQKQIGPSIKHLGLRLRIRRGERSGICMKIDSLVGLRSEVTKENKSRQGGMKQSVGLRVVGSLTERWHCPTFDNGESARLLLTQD
jgi:hypothetical protein